MNDTEKEINNFCAVVSAVSILEMPSTAFASLATLSATVVSMALSELFVLFFVSFIIFLYLKFITTAK